jgi:BASS family bile acid:Na+ symporter
LVVVIVHNATALSTGFYGATLMRVPKSDRRSLTIEVGIQNSGLGLALLFNPAIFPADVWHNNGGMVIITALWGIWHIISGLSVATLFRRKPIGE